MKILLSIIFLIVSVPQWIFSQGTLVEDTIISHLTIADINDLFAANGLPAGVLPTNYEVDVHRVIYTTPDPHGEPTTASGIICLPTSDTCAMPMLTYMHGTKSKKSSAFYYLNGEWWLGPLVATSGYAACLPDYLGLGAGPGIHPYQHAESEATATVDLLRACRIICAQEQKPLNDQLFLIGYSQGGHTTMATHRMIQEELSDEFTVTASAPGSGPYDMSGSQLDMVASTEPYSQPGYLPFLIQSYQYVYGDLYDSIQQIYIPPYDQTLPPLLDGTHDMGDINAAMPEVPRDIFQQAYSDAFFSDTLHPAYLALKDNDVYQWLPEAPVLFNYCRSDEEVSYLNTIVAVNYMNDHGAPFVEAIERDTALSHFECATPSIMFSKLWFDSMADLCTPPNVGIAEQGGESPIGIFPNPVSGGIVHLRNVDVVRVWLADITGRRMTAMTEVGPNGLFHLDGVPPGSYVVWMINKTSVASQKLIVQ